MRNVLSKIFASVMLSQVFLLNVCFSQELYVIANVSIVKSKVSIEDIRDLYLGKGIIKAIDLELTPIDGPDTQGVKDLFYKRVANFSRIELKRYWSRAIFTGKGVPPRAIPREDQLESAIAENPGYIGYMGRKPSHPKVIVLLQVN